MKADGWNPELSSKYRTNRAIGRQKKRWEDDINEFLKLEEDETDRERWTLFEDRYTMTAVERHENNARMRRNNQSRPVRYVSGVRLSDEEVANIT